MQWVYAFFRAKEDRMGSHLCATLWNKQTSKSLTTVNRGSKAAWPPYSVQGLGVGKGSRISLGAYLCQLSFWVLPECPWPSQVRCPIPIVWLALALRMAPDVKEHRARMQRVNGYYVQGSHPNQGVWEIFGCRGVTEHLEEGMASTPWSNLVLTQSSELCTGTEAIISLGGLRLQLEETQAPGTGIHTPPPQMDLLLLPPTSLIWRLMTTLPFQFPPPTDF